MDFSGPHTATENGNRYVLVFQDLFSKDVTLVATKSTTAAETAEALFNAVISKMLDGAMRLLEIEHKFSVAPDPQSHGQVERAIKTTLPKVEAAFRFARNDSTGESPYYILTQQDAVFPADVMLGTTGKLKSE